TWIRLSGRKKNTLPRAAYRRNVRMFAPANVRERNTDNGNIGCRARASTSTNATSRRVPTPTTGGADSISPKTTAPRPAVVNRVPSQSRTGGDPSLYASGTRRTVIARTIVAKGTLMEKTQRPEPCCTSHPPSTGPIAAVMDVNPDQVPIARPRSWSGKDPLIKARLLGTNNAPPRPCSPRAAINSSIVGDRPHQTDATENIRTPIANTLRRP